jgi:hypothetical protein
VEEGGGMRRDGEGGGRLEGSWKEAVWEEAGERLEGARDVFLKNVFFLKKLTFLMKYTKNYFC